jgi:putative membrane protein insertion efficiency factor
MVFVWNSGWGPRRRRRGPGYGRNYGGYGRQPAYGYRRGYGGGGGGGSCLRDLLFLNAGCCLAESLGCGGDAFLLAPSTIRSARSAGAAGPGRPAGAAGHGRPADRLIAAVRVYQREISPRHPPCCRFEPTCSAYAVQALEAHGARRGSWLTLRRLFRCRPGTTGGADPVPAVA